jgi:tetratricopeptide (TPR) repeat protein
MQGTKSSIKLGVGRVRFNFEREALRASGVKEKSLIPGYLHKLNHIHQQFSPTIKPQQDPLTRAKALFDWLWAQNQNRYQPHGNFRLTAVIEAQMRDPKQPVGNCLGLTLLYNCLLRKTGITPGAIYLENAFGKGPHVLTLITEGGSWIDVENIVPNGFDYKGHLNDSSRTRWGDKELVADIYLSEGNDLFEKKDYGDALRNYNIALRLNPGYERARLNKAIVLDRMGVDPGEARSSPVKPQR